MRSIIAAALAAACLAGPALADPATADAPKTKKVCRAVNNGNPLFPQMKCHTVPVETASAAPSAAAAPAPAADQPAQVAMQNSAQPH